MITFFVSSTFRDMHTERDMLHEQLVPALSADAFEYGDTVSLRDLRWGVNTADADSEESANRKVLSVCLEEIDQCRPYMIVFLGERYGFCPGTDLIRSVLGNHFKEIHDAEDLKEFSLPDDGDISITELEIRYGAFHKKFGKQEPKILFCERKLIGENIPRRYLAENEAAREKQQRLIKDIRKLCRDNSCNMQFFSYQAVWDNECQEVRLPGDFMRKMHEYIRYMMADEERNTEALTDWQKEFRRHREYAKTKSRSFYGRVDILKNVSERLSRGQNLVVLSGEPGCGKTALLSRLAMNFETEQQDIEGSDGVQVKTLILFCGYTPMTCRAVDLIRGMAAFLEEQMNEPAFVNADQIAQSEEEWYMHLELLVSRYQEAVRMGKLVKRRLLIFIDAADQLDDDGMRQYLSFLPGNLSELVQVVVSCVPSFPVLISKDGIVELPSLKSGIEKVEILQGMFRAGGKELSSIVLNAIAGKRNSGSPLYLSLIVQYLNMLNKEDFNEIDHLGANFNVGVTEYMRRLVEDCPDDLDAMCIYILDAVLKKTGNAQMQRAIQYLAISRFGLRETDLEKLLFENSDAGWNGLEFSRLFWYLRDLFLIRDDGRYDFFHDNVRDAYRRQLVLSKHTEEMLHRNMAEYLFSLDETDALRKNEIVYHLWRADAKKEYTDYICGYGKARITGAIPDQKNEIYRIAARESWRICTEDDSKGADGKSLWFSECMNEVNPWDESEKTEQMLYFLYDCMRDAAGFSDAELDVQRKVYEQGLVLANHLYEDSTEEQQEKRAELLKRAFDSCIDVYRKLGGVLNHNAALRMILYSRGIDSSVKQNVQDEITSRSRNLELLGDIYNAISGRENRNLALRYYRLACDMEDHTENGNVYRPTGAQSARKLRRKTADMCLNGNWESREHAIVIYESILQDLGLDALVNSPNQRSPEEQKLQSRSIREERLNSLIRLCDARVMAYGFLDHDSIQISREAVRISESLDNGYRSIASRLNRILCKEREVFLSGVQRLLPCDEIITYYNKLVSGIELLKNLWKPEKFREQQAIFLIRESVVLMYVGTGEGTHSKYNDVVMEKLKQAEHFLNECAAVSMLDNRADLRRVWMLLRCRQGDCFMRRGDLQAKFCYDEALDYAEALWKEQGTVESYSDYIVMKSRLGISDQISGDGLTAESRQDFRKNAQKVVLECLADMLMVLEKRKGVFEWTMAAWLNEQLACLSDASDAEAYRSRAACMRKKAKALVSGKYSPKAMMELYPIPMAPVEE